MEMMEKSKNEKRDLVERYWGDDYSGKYLTFNLSTENYGIEILRVREIIGMLKVTKVPRMPKYVKGVINLRGRVIPVIDLRLRFGIEQRKYDRRTCIIVVEVQGEASGMLVGVIVDRVEEVIDFPGKDLEPAPAYGSGLKTEYIRAMGKIQNKVKILLEIDRVLSQAELLHLGELAHSLSS